MTKSLLEPAPGNLFQVIKQQCNDAETKGIKLTRLSIGQPAGPANMWARMTASHAIMSNDESMHEYQDNGSPGCPNFARRFVLAHPGNREKIGLNADNLAYLPIPGIKPMLGYVVESLGSWEDPSKTRKVLTTPGYPTPTYQASKTKNIEQHTLPSLNANQGFLPTIEQIDEYGLSHGDLIMLNLPNNPTGAVADVDWWHALCDYCSGRGIRIFNDAAYAILKYDKTIPNLAQIAVDYPELSWCEAYSTSKAGNFCGWRIGAMVGSPECIGDISRVKEESDSGFNAALATGVLELFENHKNDLQKIADVYEKRLQILIEGLTSAGMEIALEPKAGFFVLFYAPKWAFGEQIHDGVHFNQIMIENAGIVGVPFGPYIRYAVCTCDIEQEIGNIRVAFEKAKIGIHADLGRL